MDLNPVQKAQLAVSKDATGPAACFGRNDRYRDSSIRKEIGMSGQRILLAAALLVLSASGDSGRAAENAHPAFAKTCGRSTMIVRCSEASPSCERNELVLRAGTAQPVVLPAPQGLEQ